MFESPAKKRRLFHCSTMGNGDDEVNEQEIDDDGYFYRRPPETILTESPEIIRYVLRNFSFRQLITLYRVCKIWKFYAEKIVKQRQNVRTLLLAKSAKCNWQSVADIAEVETFFKELDIDTRLMILFGKLPLSRPCIGGNDLLNLRLQVPSTCPILGCLSSAGIIGTDSSQKKLIDMQNPRFDCFSCICFPNIDGLCVRRFNLTLERYKNEFRPLASSFSDQSFERLFNVQPNDRVKCLILFCPSYYPFELAKEVFSAFYLRENGKIAIAGGVCEDVLEATPEAHEIAELGLSGLAFCGGDRLTAGSVVIPARAKSRKAIRAALDTCVKCNLPGKRRFGFIFTCTGRGTRIFKSSGVESGIIKAKFNDTPFVGAFSLGECGLNYWPDDPNYKGSPKHKLDEVSKVQVVPDILYTFSTTVAVISVG